MENQKFEKFNSNVILDTKEQVEMILKELKNVRAIDDYKGYRSLTDSLDSLLHIFSNRSDEEMILNHFKLVVDNLIDESTGLKEKLKSEIKNNNYRTYRDWTVSYERVVRITEWAGKFIDSINANRKRTSSLPQ